MLCLFKLLTIAILWLSMAACQSTNQTYEKESLEGDPRKLSKIKETTLPEVVRLETLKQTMFAPNLENSIF